MNHIRICPTGWLLPSLYLTLAGLWWEIRYLGLPVRAAIPVAAQVVPLPAGLDTWGFRYGLRAHRPATVSPPMLSLER